MLGEEEAARRMLRVSGVESPRQAL